MTVFWNGQLLPEGEVRISPFDPLLLRGEGTFTTMRVAKGHPEFFNDHYDRLLHATDFLGFSLPEREGLREIIARVIEGNSLEALVARVRVTVGQAGSLLVTAVSLEEVDDEVSVISGGAPINQLGGLAGLKTCGYLENMHLVRMSGAHEVLRPDLNGNLSDGCLANVFFVHKGVVHTPGLETGCLPGITRGAVLRSGVPVREGQWSMQILGEAEEIWLSSSTRHLRCATSYDGRILPPASRLFEEALEGVTSLAID